MRKATNKHAYATAQEIQDAFRIATILSTENKEVFCANFKRELGLIVSQRQRGLDQPPAAEG